MDERDEAYERLVSADPAAASETRDAVLRAKVDDLAEAAAADGPASGAGTTESATTESATTESGVVSGTTASRDDLAARRDRRRAPWWVAAGVVGAVALGGGGYALGASGAGEVTAGSESGAESGVGDDTATVGEAEALPPITLDGGGSDDADGAAAEGPPGPESLDAAGSRVEILPAPGYGTGGRATFDQDGLSTAAGSATAYAYDAVAVGSRSGAVDAAAALGVTGDPRAEHGAWSVGPDDGSGPTVRVSADATASFWYQDPGVQPWACADTTVLEQETPADGEVSEGAALQEVCETPEGSVAADDAAAQLREVMEQLGVDPGGFEIEVSEDDGGPARWVTAHQVVDDRRTGSTWHATVTTEGLASVNGFLAPLVPLGDYPVVSPVEAVERLSDPRFGQHGWPIAAARDTVSGLEPQPLPEPDVPTDQGEPTAPPAPPSSGDDLPWPVTDVTITEASIGLAQEHTADRGVVLLPAYELTDTEGGRWSMVAVAEESLDMTTP